VKSRWVFAGFLGIALIVGLGVWLLRPQAAPLEHEPAAVQPVAGAAVPATEEWRERPPGPERDASLFVMLDALHRRDPEAALAQARDRVGTREQAAIYGLFFDTFARENPTLAVARLAAVPPGPGRENALRALASVWLRADAPAALAWARNLPGDDRAPAMESALFELARRDPLQVIELAPQSLSGPALERTLFHALQLMTAADPVAAAGLVRLLPAGETQTRAALDVARGLAVKDPAAALAFVGQLPVGPAQTLALNNALTSWAATAPAAAAQYVAGLPAGTAQDAAAAHLAALLAIDPVNALAWANSLGAASARDAALIRIASTWAQADAPAASRWASAQPPGPATTTALGGALSYWLLVDAPAVRNFVSELPASSQPAAAASVAPQLAQRDPVGTIAWAQTLVAPAAREAAVMAAYSRWLDNEPAAARAWLATATIAPELRARLGEARSPNR
jgi:hypothetical protein